MVTLSSKACIGIAIVREASEHCGISFDWGRSADNFEIDEMLRNVERLKSPSTLHHVEFPIEEYYLHWHKQ
jgi:hypothetical protein